MGKPYVNQALIWIGIAEKQRCQTNIGESLSYRILKISAKMFMEYFKNFVYDLM
jgi:hypothetical protein